MVLTSMLMDSTRNGDTAAVQEWFSTGTRDPNEKDAIGWTLLHAATYGGHIETMRFLLVQGADVNVSSTRHRCSPLHWFTHTRSRHCAAAILLLDHGAQVNARTTDGKTPLMLAADPWEDDNCVIIKLLLHRGADLDARCTAGWTAERLANYSPHFDSPYHKVAALFADIRRAGGWRPYVRYPRVRLLMLRILCEQGRAHANDALLIRLFPAEPPSTDGARFTRILAAALADQDAAVPDIDALSTILMGSIKGDIKRRREAYRAQKGGLVPRGIFMHIFGYWRSDRDYDGSACPHRRRLLRRKRT